MPKPKPKPQPPTLEQKVRLGWMIAEEKVNVIIGKVLKDDYVYVDSSWNPTIYESQFSHRISFHPVSGLLVEPLLPAADPKGSDTQ